jgi:hypothetical protein
MQNRDGIKAGGVFVGECFDKFGKLKWREEAKNLITNQGLDHILDTVLHNATQVATWYIGLKNTGTPAAGDTLASHATWAENSNYTGNRKEFVEAASSSQSVTNSASKAEFAINADSQSIAGAFLCSAATGTSGTLLSAADFSSAKSCDDGDTLNVTYTISASDA